MNILLYTPQVLTLVDIYLRSGNFQQNVLNWYKERKWDTEINDTSFESPHIEHLESGEKLGVALSWNWPHPPNKKPTSFTRICMEPLMTEISPVSNLFSKQI